MSRRHATLAATLAGLTLLAAGCGGGGGSSEAASTAPTDAAALLVAADVAATPSGLTALGVTAPDPADARFHAYGTFGTPAERVQAARGGQRGDDHRAVHRGPRHDRPNDRHDARHGHHDDVNRGSPRPLILPAPQHRKNGAQKLKFAAVSSR